MPVSITSPLSGTDGSETLHDALLRVGWGRVHLTALAAFVLFVVGEAMEVSVPNVVWDKSIGEGAFGADTEGTSEALRAIVSGAPLLGHVIGGIAGGVVADTHGRRAALCVQSTVFVLASLASALSRSQPGFVATRIALGVSLGMLVPVVISFMTELAPSSHRAAVVAITGVGFPCGQSLMLACGLVLHSRRHDHTAFEWWRALLVAGVLPNLLGLALVLRYVPESPHYLLSVDRHEEAEAAVRQIALGNDSQDPALTDVRLLRVAPARDERLPSQSKWCRWRRQGAELLRPPLRAGVVSCAGIWSLASFGQVGADAMLPKVLKTELHLDMPARLHCLLTITLCAWPAFVATMVMLQMSEQICTGAFSRRAVCLGTAGASCAAAVAAASSCAFWAHARVAPMMVSCTLLKMASHGTMQALQLLVSERLPSTHRATGLACGNAVSKVLGALVVFLALSDFGPGGRFEAATHYYVFAAAFAGEACAIVLSPDMGQHRLLALDYTDLCRHWHAHSDEARSRQLVCLSLHQEAPASSGLELASFAPDREPLLTGEEQAAQTLRGDTDAGGLRAASSRDGSAPRAF